MPRFPGFVGPTYPDRSRAVSLERAINLFPRLIESAGSERRAVLEATPGNTLFTTLPDRPVRGLFFENERFFAIGGDAFCEVLSNGTVALRGTVKNDGSPTKIVSSGAGSHQIFFITGYAGYVYNTLTNVFQQVKDESFPLNPLMGEFLDGRFLALTPERFFYSDTDAALVWDASDFGERSQSRDPLVSFIVDHNELMLAGEHRTEYWRSVADAQVFAPIEGTLGEQGIEAAHSLIQFDNTIVWLQQDIHGGRMVMRGQAHTPQRISTFAMEAQISKYAHVHDATGYAYSEDGHFFYVLTFPAANATWAYDAATQLWHERAFFNTDTGQYEAARARSHVWAWGLHLVGDRQTGAIYRQGLDLTSENGKPRRWLRALPTIPTPGKRTFYGTLELGIQSGVGKLIGEPQDLDPMCELRYSDDDGDSWSDPRPMPMGKQGVDTVVKWDRLGSSYKRVFEVSGSAAVQTVLTDCTLDATAGVH